ncbi:hypothetical protein DEO72_LG9g1767 [Vigna unguiculata]|uniref:Uncharacterized protein n=1 Tax=Vigna unguiculata TaxID=3917 RepID=A0A4D6MZ22_VIGUN|nr:hypothetical protein DEO72_LG9g1767 [Vigna unguiculata]
MYAFEPRSLVLSHGSRKDKTTYFDFLASINGVEPHEETFFARKSKVQIHKAEQLRKPSQEGKVKC